MLVGWHIELALIHLNFDVFRLDRFLLARLELKIDLVAILKNPVNCAYRFDQSSVAYEVIIILLQILMDNMLSQLEA